MFHSIYKNYTEGDTLFFDLDTRTQLRGDSIRDTHSGSSVEDCSRRCLEDYIEEPCLAFDVGGEFNDMCYIAVRQYQTQPNTGSISHFEIEQMPCEYK